MLSVGQKLWYVPKHGSPEEITINRVGRKWAYCGEWRELKINMESLWADGGEYSSPGKAYLSKKDYDDMQLLIKEWQSFYARLGYSPPKGMTADKLNKIKEIIGND